MSERTYTVPDMSCGHCEQAVSSELREVAGVDAVDVDLDTKLVTAVESAGYGARRVAASNARGHDGADAGHHHRDEPLRVLTRRLTLAVVLTIPLALLAMAPPLRFAGWEWVALVLSTPVVFYS